MANAPRQLQRILIGLSLALSACGEGEIKVSSLPSDAIEVPAEVLRASGGVRPFATGAPTILYLHFDGLVITQSNKSDASTNASFIGGGTVPPFDGDQTTRDQVVSLVKQLYARYNIQIVTARPTSGNYDMAVIGGRPASLGLPYPDGPSGGVTGVAPMDCGSAMPRDIAFIFSDSIKSYVPNAYAKTVAETTAHESAHTYGLPHSNSGCDLMSYASCAQLKTFLDKTMGMQDAGSNCSMTSMNSHQLLLKALGPAAAQPPTEPPASDPSTTDPPTTDPPPTDPPATNPPATTDPPADTQAPTVVISDPANGATVASTVTLKASVTDDLGVTRADLLLDGKVVASRTTSPYEFTVTLAAGQHTLTVNAYDAASNRGTASVAVVAGDQSTPPSASTTPPDAIQQPAEAGAFGAACEAPGDCASGLCAEDSSGKYCTEACDPDADGCPDGAVCQPAASGNTVCAAQGSLGADPTGRLTGGCSVGTGPAGLAGLWPLLLVGFGGLRRLRARRSRRSR